MASSISFQLSSLKYDAEDSSEAMSGLPVTYQDMGHAVAALDSSLKGNELALTETECLRFLRISIAFWWLCLELGCFPHGMLGLYFLFAYLGLYSAVLTQIIPGDSQGTIGSVEESNPVCCVQGTLSPGWELCSEVINYLRPSRHIKASSSMQGPKNTMLQIT